MDNVRIKIDFYWCLNMQAYLVDLNLYFPSFRIPSTSHRSHIPSIPFPLGSYDREPSEPPSKASGRYIPTPTGVFPHTFTTLPLQLLDL